MTSYLVEAYLPASASHDDIERRAALAAEALRRDGAAIGFHRSIYVAEDETCFLLYQAASRELVMLAAERAGLVAQRVVEAVELPSATALPAPSPG